MNRKLPRYLFLVLCTMLLKCSCDKPDPKPDPCKAKTPVSADFYIYEFPFGTNTYIYRFDIAKFPFYDTDTTITQHVRFVPKDTTAKSYYWKIGEGVYTTTSVILDMAISDKPYFASVELTVNKLTDTTCFPQNKGTDTKKRIFYTMQGLDTSEVYGIYKGTRYGMGKEDTATIIIYKIVRGCPDDLPKIEKEQNCNRFSETYFPIYNLYNSCKSYNVFDGGQLFITNKIIMLPGYDRETCKYYPQDLIASIGKNKQDLVITYNLRFDRETPTPFTFTGIKIKDL